MSLSSPFLHLLNTPQRSEFSHLPGDSIPVPEKPFSEDVSSGFQSKSALVQLEVIFSRSKEWSLSSSLGQAAPSVRLSYRVA